MDLIRVFSCEEANAYLIIGLLLGGFVGQLIYAAGSRTRITRLWFLAGMVSGVFAAAAVYLVLNGKCM